MISKYKDDVEIRDYSYKPNKMLLKPSVNGRKKSLLSFGPPEKEEDSYVKYRHGNEKNEKTYIGKGNEGLLPILDYKYNMREIVKQCILLEDHLINVQKQCHQCIIKHFLAIEALAEEALTLNKNLTPESKLNEIPKKIREFQKVWYEDKDKNSIKVAQSLRVLRKEYMEDSFPVVFENSTENACSSNQCKLSL